MNMEGQWLMDPEIYGRNWDDGFPEAHRFFSEGLQAVIKIVGIKEWRTVHNVKTGDYQEPVFLLESFGDVQHLDVLLL